MTFLGVSGVATVLEEPIFRSVLSVPGMVRSRAETGTSGEFPSGDVGKDEFFNMLNQQNMENNIFKQQNMEHERK